MAKVYIVTELVFIDDGEYTHETNIGVVCSEKRTAVKAVNLAMSQVENKSKCVYTKKSWYKDYGSNWCKSIDYQMVGGEDYYTRLTIVEKEVI